MDLFLEILRFIAMVVVIAIVIAKGRQIGKSLDTGLQFILAGFFLLLFGSIIDLVDDYDATLALIPYSDYLLHPIVEKGVGYLLGFVLLGYGFLKWLPKIQSHEQELKKRVAIQRQLQRNETTLLHAQQLANLAHYEREIDTDRVIRISGELSTIVGIDTDQLLNCSSEEFFELMHPDEGPKLHALYEKSKYNLGNSQSEFRIIRPDGSVRYIQEIAETVINPTTKKTERFGIMQDVTEQKETEARYTHVHKMEALGQLTGGVAHDFNNILSVIIGNAELIEDQPDQAKALARSIIQAADRGATLTSHLLSFSRKQLLRPEHVDISKLMEKMKVMLRRTLREDIAIHFEHPDNIRPCLVDVAQLENAILNLAINARDAMPNGGELWVSAENFNLENDVSTPLGQANAGGYVKIMVKDNGPGIDQDMLEKIFEPFFTTKEVGDGTGLGLSMVLGFAEQSGGYMDVQSEKGKGTAFSLFLPVSPSEYVI